MNFNGKAGIVTGASSGIGRVIAITLATAGMELWLVGRSQEQLQATATEIATAGGPAAHCVSMDLAKAGALAELVAQVGEAHSHLFALINNAGVMYPEPMLEADPTRWHEMFAINVMTPMESCRAAVAVMRRQACEGHLINVSSVAAKMHDSGAYGVSKAALNHMGGTLRKELEGDDIRVTTISPGGFATNLSRGFAPEAFTRLQAATANIDLDIQGSDARKVMADPQHIADIVVHVISQPIELNFEEITIRPAVSIELA